MRFILRRAIAVLLVFLSVVCCFSSGASFVMGQVDQAGSKLQAADTAVNQAFGAVLNAEKAGANVTGLLAQLGSQVDVLAQAEIAYRKGDLGTAVNKADQVLPVAQEIRVAAENAEQEALVSGQQAFWSTIAFSAVGIAVFVFILSFVWRRVRRDYMKRMLERKPEVIGD